MIKFYNENCKLQLSSIEETNTNNKILFYKDSSIKLYELIENDTNKIEFKTDGSIIINQFEEI